MTDPLKTDIDDAKGKKPTFEFHGETYTVEKRPNPLLLAEMARTDSDDPEALGVIADFFELTLGKEQYRTFRRNFYALEDEEGLALSEVITLVMEAAFGRPTN